MSGARAYLERLLLFALASYGLLYFSYKSLDLNSGTTDFRFYLPMYLHPLDLGVAPAPFCLRQVSALLTHFVWRLHLYYPDRIAFTADTAVQRVFFAALLVNWICLVLAAAVAGSIALELGACDRLTPLLAGLLCLLSMHTQTVVVTGLTEGPSWLLFSLGYLAWLRRAELPLNSLLALAIFQRETIPVVFLVLAVVELSRQRQFRGFALRTAAWSTACAGVYLALRLFVVRGYEHQVHLSAMLAYFPHQPFAKVLTLGVLTQNLILIALLAAWRAGKRPPQLVPMLLVVAALSLLGLAVGIGPNIGRIAGLVTPVFAALAAISLGAPSQLQSHRRDVDEGHPHSSTCL
jgi:hypothetical protein